MDADPTSTSHELSESAKQKYNNTSKQCPVRLAKNNVLRFLPFILSPLSSSFHNNIKAVLARFSFLFFLINSGMKQAPALPPSRRPLSIHVTMETRPSRRSLVSPVNQNADVTPSLMQRECAKFSGKQ